MPNPICVWLSSSLFRAFCRWDYISFQFTVSKKKSFEPNQNCCNKLLGEQTVHPSIAECRRIAITWSPEVFHVEKNKSNLVFIPVEKRRMPFLCNLFAPFICCGSNHSHQIILKISIASFFSLSAMNSTFFAGCNSNISWINRTCIGAEKSAIDLHLYDLPREKNVEWKKADGKIAF